LAGYIETIAQSGLKCDEVHLKNIRKTKTVLGAALGKKSLILGKRKLTPNDVIIIGNEGHGIDEAVSLACSHSVYIPISCATESLNAAVAAAIFMWEISKT
jgi:TrmH family RNA methyltransferase